MMRDHCLACDLTEGRQPLPGGLIARFDGWRVEHCIGPFGVGTLIVKPARHVESLAALTGDEAGRLGPVLRLTAEVVQHTTGATQVYCCLWSHGPVHIHFVVQPEADDVVERFGTWGPMLQAAMVGDGTVPTDEEIEKAAWRARRTFEELMQQKE